MKKVAIVGLGWLGMPLAMSLAARGWQVTGSKTTLDGVEAARMSGIEAIRCVWSRSWSVRRTILTLCWMSMRW